MLRKLFVIISSAIALQSASAQQMTFTRKDSIDVTINSSLLTNSWAGGLNCPQFSQIDLNNDGIKDLFIFDRASNRIKTFINKGTLNTADYTYAAQYEKFFPQLKDYALLFDYNCDGKEDIFTADGSAIKVFKNTSTSSISFIEVSAELYSNYGTLYTNIYVSSVCLPAIVDIDGDGDLDILNFEIGGGYIECHRNQSKEFYGHCDSLIFKADKDCWGHVSASAQANDVTLNSNCFAYRPARNERVQHQGSTLLAFDADGDGDKDMLVGDIIADNLLFLNNGGTVQDANITSKIDSFPSNDVKANVPTFPAAYNLDLDNDGVKDLLIAPNNPVGCESAVGIWFYKNTGSNAAPVFKLQTKAFLQNEMIEVGENAKPAFFDYDADGLQDLLIGNYGYYATPNYLSGITLFKNTGTVLKPAFTLITKDYANLNQYNLKSVNVTFGDIDGDGDKDMLIGEDQGRIFLATNTAGAANPASFQFNAATFFNIDAGNSSAPFLTDIDNDGVLDLLIGTSKGNIEYYHNDGKKTLPNLVFVTKSFGGIDVRSNGDIIGYSSPIVLNLNGKKQILLGSAIGNIFVYNNVEANIGGTFTKADTALNSINEGLLASLAATDLNADGDADLVICNQLGGCALYYQNGTHATTTGIKDLSLDINPEIQPNPASESIKLTKIINCTHIEVTDMLGKAVFTSANNYNNEITINCSAWPSGIYICKLSNQNKSAQVKLIIAH